MPQSSGIDRRSSIVRAHTMRIVFLLLLSGCASQLDIREGDCSITMVEVDAKASTPVLGGVEADGWTLVQRGACDPALIAIFRKAVDGN